MTTHLPLHVARAALDAALAHATAAGLRVSVVVVDRQGHEVVLARADDAAWFTVGVAGSKARTAAAFGRPSSALAVLRETYPEVLELAADQLPYRPTTLPGGLPLLVDDEVVGAVGVSGADPDQDVACADAARAAITPTG